MTDQPIKNLAFELHQTNESLEALATVMLAFTEPGSESEIIVRKELDSTRARIKRLFILSKK